MKKKILFLLISLIISDSFLYAAKKKKEKKQASLDPKEISVMISSTKTYDSMFDNLSKRRVGLTEQQISEIKNPFTNSHIPGTKVASKDDASSFKLTAIIGRRAKINNSWYSVGDYVGMYKVIGIGTDSVQISGDSNTIKLKLERGNKNVVIKFN